MTHSGHSRGTRDDAKAARSGGIWQEAGQSNPGRESLSNRKRSMNDPVCWTRKLERPMIDHVTNHNLWIATKKADRLLDRLPCEQIAYLGDGFGWAVSSDDVTVARRLLTGERLQALLLGYEIAQLSESDPA